MTMFVRATEAFIGRIVILLVLCLLVAAGAYLGAQEASQWDFSNQVDGLVFQIKIQATAMWHEILSWYHWLVARVMEIVAFFASLV